MKHIVMTQPLCREGYEIMEKEGSIFVADNPTPSEYMEEVEKADCIIVRIARLNREEIEGAPRLSVIGRTGVGYDSVDVAAATERGIPVVITPGANGDAVAEHTIAMLFALSNNLVEAHNETLKGNFAIRGSGKAFELHGKTLGILGTGDIGKRVAKLAQALSMNVCGYDPAYSKEDMEALGIRHCGTLEELLSISDAVSIHTPLTPSTSNMIRLEQLRQMKPSSFLINCARGGIVNEEDLVHALDHQIIAGAGTDVFLKEPPNEDHIFFRARNLIVSPHSAAQTKEAVINMAVMCAQGCCAVLAGKKWPHVANPGAYDHPRWKS
ncbi:hydroxyacid dehydrogenase [Lachnospiraceae bacterium 54-53]